MIAIMSAALFDCLAPHAAPEQALAAGQALFHRGDPVEALVLVAAGEVHLVRHGPGGTALVLQRAEAGDVLAEASIWSETHHCDAVAVRPSRVRRLTRRRALDLLGDPPPAAAAYLAHLSEELRRTRLRAEILSLRTVAERLEAWLAWQGNCLPERGTWRHLAAELGVSEAALYRELAKRREQSR